MPDRARYRAGYMAGRSRRRPWVAILIAAGQAAVTVAGLVAHYRPQVDALMSTVSVQQSEWFATRDRTIGKLDALAKCVRDAGSHDAAIACFESPR